MVVSVKADPNDRKRLLSERVASRAALGRGKPRFVGIDLIVRTALDRERRI